MRLAGHSDFETTRRFYLAVRENLLQKARTVSKTSLNLDFGTHLARAPFSGTSNEEHVRDNSLTDKKLTPLSPTGVEPVTFGFGGG